jgi:hypothetical protein
MMETYCVKAQLRDGLDILDLGCGEIHTIRQYSAFSSSDFRLGLTVIISSTGKDPSIRI